MVGHRIEPREYEEPKKYYYTKTVDTMTDVEIKHKLCRTAVCLKCDVMDVCRYGQEAKKRGLLKAAGKNA